MLGVNPFNQPGVESYKKNMFALLGKPGYEAQKAELEAKREEGFSESADSDEADDGEAPHGELF